MLDLYGQVIGVDLLDNGLYFGFEGPAFRFPSQLCDVASLQQTLEVLYFFKVSNGTIDVLYVYARFNGNSVSLDDRTMSFAKQRHGLSTEISRILFTKFSISITTKQSHITAKSIF